MAFGVVRGGAPFLLDGTVVEGDRRGRTLGFPTANLVPDDELVCPGHGVYAAFANGLPAAVNVGVRPTFATGRGVLVEAYLIDHEADLYALVAQMHRDVDEARRLCASFSAPSPISGRGVFSEGNR